MRYFSGFCSCLYKSVHQTRSLRASLVKLAAVVLVQNAAAQGVTIGNPSFVGTGCPSGSVAAALSNDNKQLSILFDRFTVSAGGANPTTSRKDCAVNVPIQVPNGYSVAILAVDYRGFMSLPLGGEASLRVDYSFGGNPGITYFKSFMGELTQDYMFTNQLNLRSTVWSACGGDVNLRTQAGLSVTTNRHRDQAEGSVDSIDVSAGTIYTLQYRNCQANPINESICQPGEMYFQSRCVHALTVPKVQDVSCAAWEINEKIIAARDTPEGRNAVVRAAYCVILGREADPGGQAFWVSQLDSGAVTRQQLLISMAMASIQTGELTPTLTSAWVRDRLYVSNRSLLVWSYAHLLGREPDAGGYQAWIGQNDPYSAPDINYASSVFAGFLGSQEFLNRYPIFRNR